MKPPFFVWKSGTLDVCDTLEELKDRYPPQALLNKDAIACDSQGRAILVSRAADGTWADALDEPQPPSPDLLRSVLRSYLEKCGVSPEEIDSLALPDLVARAYPDDPLPENAIQEGLLWKFVYIPLITLLCIALSMLLSWWCGQHWQ